jgi:phosphoglycolate phosphatase
VFGIEDNRASSKLERGKQLMALSHIPRKDTILVGDTDHDLEVGNALGIEVILVDHGHQSFERLSAAHDKVVHYLGFEEGNKRSTGIR